MFILKYTLYIFGKDTPFIIRSLRITLHAAVCTYAVTNWSASSVGTGLDYIRLRTLSTTDYDARSVQYQIALTCLAIVFTLPTFPLC